MRSAQRRLRSSEVDLSKPLRICLRDGELSLAMLQGEGPSQVDKYKFSVSFL